LEIALSKIDTGSFAIGKVIGSSDVVKVRQLMDHSLHLLRVVREGEREVTYVHVLAPVGRINISIGVSLTCKTGHVAIARLAPVDGVHLHCLHSVELSGSTRRELRLGSLCSEPSVHLSSARALCARSCAVDLVNGVFVPSAKNVHLAGSAAVS